MSDTKVGIAAAWETIKATPVPPNKYTWYKERTKLQLTEK